MLRRRERTARWRGARGGGRAPPRSRGPGAEDCSKTLPRPGVFQRRLQDGGRLVTHCSRGARGKALCRQQCQQLRGQMHGTASSASACGCGQVTLASPPSTGSMLRLTMAIQGKGLWAQPSMPNEAASTWGAEQGLPHHGPSGSLAEQCLDAGAWCPPATRTWGQDTVPSVRLGEPRIHHSPVPQG